MGDTARSGACGDRIDTPNMSRPLSGAQTCYYVNTQYSGYNPSVYADVVEEEDGTHLSGLQGPEKMKLCSYMDWGDFERFRKQLAGRLRLYLSGFEIVKESGIEGIEADSDPRSGYIRWPAC